jgi:excisionase family DNA binding protein
MLDPLSIPEAAALLQLSPGRVHALVAGDQMQAVKVGGRWLIERNEVERRRRSEGLKGRPFAPHNAWALLRLASGEEVGGLDPSVRSRLRKALAKEGLQQLAPRLARRGESRYFHAHRGEIPHVLEDPRFVASGANAAGAHGLDLVPGREADGYVPASAERKFVADHALMPAAPGANVHLRVVPDAAWGFSAKARVAPLAAVALDLAEEADPRSSAAGRAALKALPSS